jgi:hypothetical protein
MLAGCLGDSVAGPSSSNRIVLDFRAASDLLAFAERQAFLSPRALST